MYTKFRGLLEKAQGRNEWVVAINADIRGFSSGMSGDPAETALYLRAVYGRILDNYFTGRSFFKPTGDGLLVVVPFQANEENLALNTKTVVGEALQLHADFATMIDDDKLVKFPHPNEIGIGLSVGSVSRLVSGKFTLDYTGRPLNLASRLMDLARPSGVVFDASLDFTALDAKTQATFRPDHVYLKGVADEDGVDIFFTSPPTLIPERYRKPLRKAERYEEDSRPFTRAEAATRTRRSAEHLMFEPSDRSTLEVLVVYPVYRKGKRVARRLVWYTPEFEYSIQRGKPSIMVSYNKIANQLKDAGVPLRADVKLDIAYMVDTDVLQEKGVVV